MLVLLIFLLSLGVDIRFVTNWLFCIEEFYGICKFLGLVALTLDRQSVLVVEISEIFGKSVPTCLREDGKIIISHKALTKVTVIVFFIMVSSHLRI